MKSTRTLVAVAVLASLAGCGNGGTGSSEAPPIARVTPDDAVRAAAVAGVITGSGDEYCGLDVTLSLVKRIYGSLARCKRIAADGATSPNSEAEALADKVDGVRAIVRLKVTDGDDENFFGDLRLRYESAAWRIDGYGADYLRQSLGAAVAARAEEISDVNDISDIEVSDIENCTRRRFTTMSDETVQRVGYQVVGERRDGLRVAYRELGKCLTRGVSVLRRLFERDLRSEIVTDSDSRAIQLSCVLRGLRLNTSDNFVADLLSSGDIDSLQSRRALYPKLREAAIACDTPKPHRPTLA